MSGFEDIMDRLKSRAAPDPAMQREEYECLKCRDTGWSVKTETDTHS